MSSTRSRSFLTFACAALAAAASAFTTTLTVALDRIATGCTALYRFACNFIQGVPAKFAQPRMAVLAHPVELVQSCAYALGLAKRERPHVRSQWRMCPSI